MEVYMVSAAAILGTLLVGTVAWLKSQEPFDARKFSATVVMAVIAGATIGVAYMSDTIQPRDLLMALLAGAGVDYARSAVSGAIAARAANTTK